jgi:hypothetical protein
VIAEGGKDAYLICGTVNAKSMSGAYSGPRRYFYMSWSKRGLIDSQDPAEARWFEALWEKVACWLPEK